MTARPAGDSPHHRLALLDARARTLVQYLAAWGAPATLADLAPLYGAPASALVPAAQAAVDAQILDCTDQGELSFCDEAHRAAADRLLAPGLRSTLAAEISRRRQRPDTVPASLELSLATALTRTGQLSHAAEVATEGLSAATDPAIIAQLHRILLFTLLAQGSVDQVRERVTVTLELPLDAETRAVLINLRRYADLLGGRSRLPGSPYLPDGPGTVSETVTEALRSFLTGDGARGLELALDASRRETAGDDGSGLSSSAEIWPPFIEQHLHGPDAAAELLDRAAQLRTDRGAAWMIAYHEFIGGGIAFTRGRFDTAASTFDAGLDRADAAGLGWTSIAVGTRAMIDVFRNEHTAALNRLDRFAESGLPDQFGVPVPAHARALLLEAQRKLQPAARIAGRAWDRAIALGLRGWLPVLAVDVARIAVRAQDTALTERLVDDLSGLPGSGRPAQTDPVALAVALCSGPADRLAVTAVAAARAAEETGNRVAAVAAWEEAACARAADGDKTGARDHAHTALRLAQEMGAPGLAVRITSRLRALGLRLDPAAARDRARTGWDSLTPTETLITDLVAAGLTGAEIGAKLHISQRTVQTHVSHVLAKLNLRTRIELASAVARRSASAQ